MKKYTLKTVCVLIGSVLIASASALAQVAPPAPSQFVPGNSDTSLVMPKAKANLYVEAGLIYTNTKIGDQYHSKQNSDMFGINAAFGWRIDQHSKIQVDVGVLAGSDIDVNKLGTTEANSVQYSAVPVLASYSYCVPLGKNHQWEIRLTPTVGFNMISADYDGYVTRRIGSTMYEIINGRDSGVALAYGAGIGVTYHINSKFYVDVGYRFLGVGSVDMDYTEIQSQTTHSAIASIGWKF